MDSDLIHLFALKVGVLCEGPLLFDAANADGAGTWAAAAQKIVVAIRGEEDRLQIESRGNENEETDMT